ncbi:MAG: DUF2846 domain-containing protein [Dysgonamonadaceae bacterium]|jgi:uncharacterized ubiquitin-like protein YukD|nr:DUF2846 domain-containing protein [Dysgonamonadaceae bacterium]
MKSRRILLTIGLCLGWILSVTAQDTIILKTGDEIRSRVLEIGDAEVKYKKFENPDGPLYVLGRAEIFMIKYENGTKDVFGLDPVESAEPVLEKETLGARPPANEGYYTEESSGGDYAVINIYRPKKMTGSMLDYDLRLGDEWVLCKVKNNTWASVQVNQTGLQKVWAKTETRSEVFLNIEPGKVYYIRCGVKMGVMVGRPSIEIVPNEIGEAEFREVQLSPPKK